MQREGEKSPVPLPPPPSPDPVNGSAAREDPEFQTQMQEFSESLEETMHAIVSSKEFRNKVVVFPLGSLPAVLLWCAE